MIESALIAPIPEAFANLTRLVTARYPGYPPYGGAYDDVIETVRADIEPGLPIRGIVREVHLFTGANEAPGWGLRERFPLG